MDRNYETIALHRVDDILELRIHHKGEAARWAFWGGLHRELGLAFAEIAADASLRALILTGTGDAFCAESDLDGEQPPAMSPATWDVIYREGRSLLNNLLAIEVPVIAAVNGPAFIHAELAVLADIVLASDTAIFADKAHGIAGVVPGDGVHTIWPMVLGPNRGRYFLLTGQEIGAQEALTLGIVGEVLAPERLLNRAWEHARSIAARPALAMRYARVALTTRLREQVARYLGPGLMLEGMAILAGRD